jgi:hypothetical protein
LKKAFCTVDNAMAGFLVGCHLEAQKMLLKSLLELLELLPAHTNVEKRTIRKRKAVWVKEYLKTRQT